MLGTPQETARLKTSLNGLEAVLRPETIGLSPGTYAEQTSNYLTGRHFIPE